MIIIARQREALKSQHLKKDLNSILKEWNWSGVHPKDAQEFLGKFKPWVQDKIKLGKEVEELLTRKGVDNLADIE